MRFSRWAFALSVGLLLIVSSFGLPASIFAEPVQEETKAGNTIYHDYGELTADLQAIEFAYPLLTKLESIGQTWEGREIWAMKISDNVDIEEPDEPELFFNGCHHAREWLTVEVCYWFIIYLVENYTSDPTATYLIENRQIWVVPMVNPDGREYDGGAQGDEPSSYQNWRKNRRNNGDGTFGVDLNRNYGYMWGVSGACSDTSSEVYGGPSEFSEPESQACRDFARNHSFVGSISFHSHSMLILWPWGWSFEEPPDNEVLSTLGVEMSNNITNLAGSSSWPYTPEQACGLYPTSGGDIDWLYGELGILAYVTELYPGGSDGGAAISAPYNRFHPREDKVIPVVLDNIPGMVCMSMIADNPNQIIDHIVLTPNPDSQLINQDTTGYYMITAHNDGKRTDTFDITSSGPSGMTINHPNAINLLKGGSMNFTLDVTVPAFYIGGDYTIWINATSQTNPSCHYGTQVTVTVPFYYDTAIVSHSPFVENGQYPQGSIDMTAEVMNLGQADLDPFNLTCTISQMGASLPNPVFTEDFETDLSQWTIHDHDQSQSSSEWKLDPAAHNGVQGAWCGLTTSYTDTTIQSLETAVPISLRGASGANLSFWHRYDIERDYDFGAIEVSDDGGQNWYFGDRYTGVANTWHQETVDLTEYAGTDDLMLRFLFTSDGGVTAEGWHIDDVLVEADFRSESIIWGPTPQPTPGILYQNDTLECHWQYTFNPGHYKATYETTLASDERADNDLMDVFFEITPADLPDVVVIQPNSGEVWVAGSSEEITWNVFPGSHPLKADPITISYSIDGPGGPYTQLATNEPDDGTYTWNPIPPTPSNDCWVLIEAEDDQGFVGADINDIPFGIMVDPPNVTVTSPNGGESLMGGASWLITWIATGNLKANPITIEYSTTGPAGPWIPLASNEPNDGVYNWDPVPSLDVNNCYVRIEAEDMLGFFGEDISDGAFEIDSTAPLPALNPRAELDGLGVRIYWDPSPSADVDRYEVWWRMNGFDPSGNLYTTFLGAGLGTDVLHSNVGANNPNSYTYQVRTFDAAGHEARTIIQAAKYGSTQSVFTRDPDWFLLGSPLVQSDASIAHVIQGQGLPANLAYLRKYDSLSQTWLSYNPAAPSSIQDFTDIYTDEGFWMHISSSTRFATAGYLEDKVIDLVSGWNLVAYPFAQRFMGTAAIEAHLLANCIGYDAMLIEDLTNPYHLKIPIGTENIFHNQAIWIHVSLDTTWTVVNYT